MATEFSVLLPPSDVHLVEAALEALEELDAIEATLTIYRPESEISRINQNAFDSPVKISEPTFQLLQTADRWSKRTAGAFDVTVGPLVRAWGFTERRGRKPQEDEIRAALQRVGHDKLVLDAEQTQVRLLAANMEINLGAIGKGYALDRLADDLVAKGLRNFLIHGGGSSILARGNQSESDAGWAVGITHPTKPHVRLAGIRLHDESLSTSGSGKQFFHFRGQRLGHVIDPRTGYPTGDMLSLTAVADNATDAEACSTGYFVAGSEAIRSAMESIESLPKMIGTRATGRQDEAEVIAFAEFAWVDPPEG